VNQQSELHLGEGRSHLVFLLLRERCGQVLPEPVEMLAVGQLAMEKEVVKNQLVVSFLASAARRSAAVR